MNLAPAAEHDFHGGVAIPPEAADQASDGVTITATSQGDSSKTDSALLTTASTGQSAKNYLPLVRREQSD